MPSLEELRERFREDRYATQLTGADILEAEPGRALVGLRLRPDHLNANQKVMGGAVFTLADFAFAVAANGFADHRVPARVRHLPRPGQGTGAAGGGQVRQGRADHLPV